MPEVSQQLTERVIGAAIQVRLLQKRVGLLMNFHVPVLKSGIQRIIL